jgi:exonuclease III
MKSQLQVLSLNINGLRDDARRRGVFYWLKQLVYDVILLQDVRCQRGDIELWSQEWGMPVLWSEYNAILLTNRSMSISKVDLSFPLERCLVGKISCGGVQGDVVVGSIYVPAGREQRRKYLLGLHDVLHEELCLLGGDFNVVADPAIDKFPPKNERASKDWEILASKMQKWDLSDLHSRLSPGITQLTHWQNTQVGAVGSRIDYIWVCSQKVGLFSETELQACSFSDHFGVVTKMKMAVDIPRGRGLWKMNTSILEVREVGECIQEILSDAGQQVLGDQGGNAFGVWEEAKSLVQAVSIFHARRLALSRRRQEASLEGKLGQLSAQYVSGCLSSGDWVKESNQTKQELKQLIQHKVEGYRVRGKVRWLEEGERPSRYFHNLIKARQTQASMLKVKCSDGSVVSDSEGILREARSYYQQLYSKGQVSGQCQGEILQYVQGGLSQVQQRELDRPIDVAEVVSAIQEASSRSSPGKDGIPYEFYKAFQKEVAPILVHVYNEVWQGKELKASALESVVILIFKKKGNEEELKNWRPISLLNCDLKLLTKIMAKRLQKYVASIVHRDQAGFVSGRRIQDSCMLLAQILESNRVSPVAGGLYFLDQEKAYDRVDWSFMLRCLERFGFGPRWVHMVSIIYGKLRGRVLVNGFQSLPFEIYQGVRQGDPLSPLLFNLAIEPLLACIRNRLHGIHLPGLVFKVSAFADDVLLGVDSPADFQVAQECLNLYAAASNAKLNADKCQTLVLGDKSGGDMPVLGQVLEEASVVVYLGVPFHCKCFPLPFSWYEKQLTHLSHVVSSWQKRCISLLGRVHLVNSRLLSKLWYLSYFVSWPPWFLKRLKQLVTTFLWDTK